MNAKFVWYIFDIFLPCLLLSTVFLYTDVFKGPRLSTLRIFESQTHFKPTETFQYTHFSSCHPFITKKGFIKEEALSQSRWIFVSTNETLNKDCNRGYPTALVHKILTEVQFSNRTEALRNKTKKVKEILPFVSTNNTATMNLKTILIEHWHIIQQQPRLAHICNQPPIISYRKKKNHSRVF